MLVVERDSPLARGCALFGLREQGKNMRSEANMWMLPRRRSEVAWAVGGAWAAGPVELTIEGAGQPIRPFMIGATIGRIEPKLPHRAGAAFRRCGERASARPALCGPSLTSRFRSAASPYRSFRLAAACSMVRVSAVRNEARSSYRTLRRGVNKAN